MKNILILNGPNLNLLGKRQPEIYGNSTFESYLKELREEFSDLHIVYLQSNHEGVLIDALHEYGFEAYGIIINPGGYTHTSIALADAVSGIEAPVVEVHISNIYEREAFRHHSYIKSVAAHSIVGKGLSGYQEAITYLRKI